jgi:NAD(P)-dependent dehydrogenase (short-subunit alcohol dehydrogenase family)
LASRGVRKIEGVSNVVVITGASGGIGRATARRFAQDGAKIALLARGRAGLEGAAKEVEARGGTALVIPTDVADADQVEAAAQAAEDELGPIDIWVNDAMATIYAEFLDIEPDEYRRATDVTYHGMVWGTRSALKRMAERNRGAIVQVCSAMSYRGIPLQAPYCGAKAACKNFTESVITEIRHHGWDIHVSMVQLAGFNTTQFTWGRTKLPKQTKPVPPFYQPEIAADAIHWAAYHRRRQIFVGMPTVLNIVGERVAPWFLDWYLAKTAFGSQMTNQPLQDGPGHDNLFEPVDEDRGAHGPFDEKAHAHSFQTSLSKHRRLAGSLAAGVGAAATGAALLRKR